MVMSKSRVAPKKGLTISRLELLACLIGARLAQQVIRELGMSEEKPWETFVSNRVKELRNLTTADKCYHLAGKKNPADLPSRRCSVHKLRETRWWEEPDWLQQEEKYCYHASPIVDTSEVNQELKKTAIAKLKEAEVRVLRHIQQSVGDAGLGSRVKRMNVFKDLNGLLRLKSSLYNTKSELDIRCPIILPGNNEVVKLLIRKAHETALHVGVQTVQHLLRHKFWVLKGKRAVRFNAKKATVESIPIPEDRVRTVAPFQATGVDLTGPMYLRGGKKVWIVLYTCAMYRAVHLELIHSLFTEGFLRSLRRFIARRGRPVTIYFDNGLNFVGCNNLFRQVDWNEVQRHVTISRITWKFNSPTAAWWRR
ncbi:hypothetical protein ILUMI_14548 [Ignelater luminosus]|uniref:Integrase catalytic domain-containing protein n=1 Tax=Ignelater luminosus TaxID=2038154 RepID=A0A8K0CQA2_IGNLU|nr:hypothetical protein ILUMI_14548 [Ignelater luminosus]